MAATESTADVSAAQFLESGVRVQQDNAHQVVVVVGQAARQTPDGFEFLRLQEPLLSQLAVGDIDVDAGHPNRRAVAILEDLPAPAQPMNASIGPNHSPFSLGGRAGLERLLDEFHGPGPILGMYEILPCRLCPGKSACRQAV